MSVSLIPLHIWLSGTSCPMEVTYSCPRITESPICLLKQVYSCQPCCSFLHSSLIRKHLISKKIQSYVCILKMGLRNVECEPFRYVNVIFLGGGLKHWNLFSLLEARYPNQGVRRARCPKSRSFQRLQGRVLFLAATGILKSTSLKSLLLCFFFFFFNFKPFWKRF